MRLTSVSKAITSAPPLAARTAISRTARASRSSPRSAMQTRSPIRANRLAAASPMPAAPPVTTATDPGVKEKCAIVSSSVRGEHSAWRRLVRDQPVQAELLRRLHELSEIDGLAYEAVGAQTVAGQNVLFLVAGSQYHDRNAARALVGPHAPQDIETAEFRHFEIEQNHRGHGFGIPVRVRAGCEQVVERLDAVANDLALVEDLAPFECAQREFLIVGIVLDEQNGIGSIHQTSTSCARDGNCEEHGRSAIDGALRPDTAAVTIHDTPNGRQPNAGAGKICLAMQALKR